MIVPEYWAEARVQHRAGGRQVTVRRFGWSDAGEAQARAMAQQRADEALQRILRGEALARREPKVAYNGADGVPIREEILARHGAAVLTRNGYGAHCLNTPEVLFADVDFDGEPSLRLLLAVAAGLLAAALPLGHWLQGAATAAIFAVLALLGVLPVALALRRGWVALQGGDEALALRRVRRWLAARPDWQLRVYRTPAGLRLLATHQTFSPHDPAVQAFFRAVGTDPVYARMCRRQNCFRARVSAKPWRAGVARHLRPGRWPVPAEAAAQRAAWVAQYEAAAARYAACRFLTALGDGPCDRAVAPVVELHDGLCRATEALPLA